MGHTFKTLFYSAFNFTNSLAGYRLLLEIIVLEINVSPNCRYIIFAYSNAVEDLIIILIPV